MAFMSARALLFLNPDVENDPMLPFLKKRAYLFKEVDDHLESIEVKPASASASNSHGQDHGTARKCVIFF